MAYQLQLVASNQNLTGITTIEESYDLMLQTEVCMGELIERRDVSIGLKLRWD